MDNQFFPLTPKEAEKLGVKYSSKDNKASGFPSRLRALRDAAGISQQKLADEIGVTKSTVGLYEAGDNVPDAKTIYKLAKFFTVSADYLLGLCDIKSTEPGIISASMITGLSEKIVWYLFVGSLDQDPSYTLIENLLNELATNEKDAREICNDIRKAVSVAITALEEPAPLRVMQTEEALDIINFDNRHTPGMIKVPAKDAESWYLDNATNKVSTIARAALEKTINQRLNQRLQDRQNLENRSAIEPSDEPTQPKEQDMPSSKEAQIVRSLIDLRREQGIGMRDGVITKIGP